MSNPRKPPADTSWLKTTEAENSGLLSRSRRRRIAAYFLATVGITVGVVDTIGELLHTWSRGAALVVAFGVLSILWQAVAEWEWADGYDHGRIDQATRALEQAVERRDRTGD